jgi:UTP--glucose-1-phosphate uridylyltransferase
MQWWGIFYLDAEDHSYSWAAQKYDGAYGEDYLELFMYPVLAPNATELEVAHEAFEALVDASAPELEIHPAGLGSNTTIIPEALLKVVFDAEAWLSVYSVEVPASGYYAVFCNHDPEEFATAFHYLRDNEGNDIEPVYSSKSEDVVHEDYVSTRWGVTIGACVVVWLVTFVGVVFITMSMLNVNVAKMDFYGKLFAAGALLGTSFCIILLEAGHYIESNSSLDEAESHGHWAAMVLTGFLTPLVVELISKSIYGCASEHTITAHGSPVAQAPAAPEAPAGDKILVVREEGMQPLEIDLAQVKQIRAEEATYTETTQRTRVVYAVLVGDFFHNFCDGIFIGAAFKSCSVSFGWTVASITIAHEVIQELADFLVLTKAAQLSYSQVLTFNALSGLSVIFGGIAIASSDISDYAVGMLLAFGAGQYIYTGAVELMPTFNDSHHDLLDHLGYLFLEGSKRPETSKPARVSMWDKAVGLCMFVVGVVAVGLVLLNHSHCEEEAAAEGGAAGHDSHNH